MRVENDGSESSTSALILCVDDEERTRTLVETSLTGFRVMSAPSSGRGLLLAKRFPFDLYLLNARLPDLPGADFCRAIRQFDARTPVVAYAAHPREGERQALVAAGATLFLAQPLDVAELEARIRVLLDESRLHSAVARIAEHSAVLDELRDRSRAVEMRIQEGWQESQRIRNRLLRIRAYRVFIEAGGSRANFRRIWPGMADSFDVKDR